MATQHQIADFVARRLTVGRVQPGQTWGYPWYHGIPYFGPELPVAEQIADELLQDAEFRALQLGGFFNTPAGEFVEQAVEIVVPRTLAPEFGLIVSALKLAANLQQGESRGKALLSLGGGIIVAVILKEMTKAA